MIVTVECRQPLSRNGAVWLEFLQFFTLIHGAAHLGVEAETVLIGTVLLLGRALVAGNGLQGQHFLLSIDTS